MLTQTLLEAIQSDGLGTPDIVHDGAIHRFTSPEDKHCSNNCWYVSHGTAAAYGSWKLGFTKTWNDGSKRNDDAALLRQIKEAQKHRIADLQIQRKDAENEAAMLWSKASKDVDHQYPDAKIVVPFGARQLDDMLLIPMYHDGRLVNIQRIFPDGKKLFLKGALVTGCYAPIGQIQGAIAIVEGWATGCTVHLNTGYAVAVAFNCNNLPPVAQMLRKRNPSTEIIIYADNDTKTKGNPGRTKAEEAAALVGGYVSLPIFDEDQSGTDWNDFVNLGGDL